MKKDVHVFKKDFGHCSVGLFAVVLMLLGLSCGKPTNCNKNKLPRYNYSHETHRFFDVYKEGNWWIYITSDKMKEDCVYVKNYTEVVSESCQQKNVSMFREMNIFSKHIFDDNENRKSIYNTGPERTTIILNGYKTNFQFFFDGTSIKDTHSETSVPIVASEEVNGTTYFNILSTDRVKIAENVGIIYTVFEGDTFLLEKHHIR